MVRINENECVGCGICRDLCPEGIDLINGKARIKNEGAECLKEAADACPRGCIVLDDDALEKPNNNIEDSLNDELGQGRGPGFGQGLGQGRGMGTGKGRGLGGGPRDGSGRGRGGGPGMGRKR